MHAAANTAKNQVVMNSLPYVPFSELRRRRVLSLRETRVRAARFLREEGASSLRAEVLCADGRVALYRFGARGGVRRLRFTGRCG